MNVEATINGDRADDDHGICIGRIRADGEVYDHHGVHIGHVDADGTVRSHTGVHIGHARQSA